jgi:hypothetical protein
MPPDNRLGFLFSRRRQSAMMSRIHWGSNGRAPPPLSPPDISQSGTGPRFLGRDEAGKPRAARFPAGHDTLVAKAAKAMNLAVCKAESADVAELAKKLPPGRLYSTGRGFVPPVGRSLYDKLVEQLKLAGQPVPSGADQPNGDRSGAAQAAPGLPSSWDDIAVGHLVIAHESAIEGWYEAIVLARDGDMLTLKWRDYPQQAHVLRHAGTVALLKPGPVNA